MRLGTSGKLLALLLCFLVGCQTAVSPTPPPSPTNPPAPVLAAATATETAVPPTHPPTNIPATTTPLPTTTQLPTATPLPTAPPQPTATLPPTSAPTATAIIPDLIGPTEFPDNVNPLTGETVRHPDMLAKRPLAIKISNAPAYVRPQAGLNSADLVFEHLAEAGLTRFTAVFYTHDVDTVGSIRSGRLIDLEIPRMYDAAFAYSGSAGRVREQFRASNFFERIVSVDFAHGGFFRIEDPAKRVEHTLFTNTYNLRYILDMRGQDVAPTFQNGMAFRQEPLTPGEPATRVEIAYEGTNATWGYSNGRYRRWTDGEPHLDANSGQQLSFKNIVVIAAEHVPTDIVEDNFGGEDHFSLQIQIWGEGPVSVFRDGVRINGRWDRQDPNHMLTFTDLDGNILPLAPGNTFFQLVPKGFDQLYTMP
ncbi:MAG: DUF3048 domain-containing protein [Chloroflexota bacterium]